MTVRREYPFVLGALCALMSWLAIGSWADMVEDPGRFTGPAFTGAAIVALTGAAVRTTRTPWWAVLAVQVLAVTSWLHHRLGADGPLAGWLPTWQGLRFVGEQIRDGAAQVNRYTAPIEAEQAQAPIYLLATALAVILIVDLIACGLHQAPWAGLPVLVSLTVPISVLDTSLPLVPLAGVAGLYLGVISYSRSAEILTWGQGSASTTGDQRRPGVIGTGPAVGIGVVTTLAALTLPAFVPVGSGILGTGGGGSGGRGPGAGTITLENPLVDLRRDLQQNLDTPVLDARTDATDPGYLRMTVLDRFTGASWVPGPRSFPAENRASGPLPDPAGITSQSPGTESDWQLRTSVDFVTSWLPVPFPTRSLSTGRGDWRFDSTTLDIASTDDRVPAGIVYSAVGFSPTIDAADLDAADPAPPELLTAMTQVPNLDDRVTAIARTVTAGAGTDYERAVRLQRWFRTTGGFTYSLDQAPGSGMRQLVRFLTTDKVGYCEQFAASMAVMARALGIPARVVVGFLAPEKLGPGRYRFTSSDLHAWPEVYFSGSGWVRFEPTPGARTGLPPTWTVADVPVPAPATATPTPTQAVPTGPRVPEQQDVVTASGEASRTPIAIGILVTVALVGLLALPGLVRRSQRSRRLAVRDDGRAEVEDLWGELRATAIDLRSRWPDGRSVRSIALAVRSSTPSSPADDDLLDALVGLVERARYQRTFDLDDQDRATARTAVARWSDLLALSSHRRAVRSARWFPRSVLRRGTPDAAPLTPGDRSRDLTGVG